MLHQHEIYDASDEQLYAALQELQELEMFMGGAVPAISKSIKETILFELGERKRAACVFDALDVSGYMYALCLCRWARD